MLARSLRQVATAMARPLRIDIPGAVYHVTSRGLEQRDIVRDTVDCKAWSRLLDQTATRRGWRVYAWALMSNHFHLFMKVPAADLSAGMHDLNSGYASVYNRRHRRCGPLFQGRFWSILVDQDHHFWALTRYVHMNPVRAGVTQDPETYPWSSCSLYFETHLAPDWLAWRDILREHGNSLHSSQQAYRRFLMEDTPDEGTSPLSSNSSSIMLGSPAFRADVRLKIQDRLPDRGVPAARGLRISPEINDILEAVGEILDIDTQRLLGKRSRESGRAVAIYLARSLGRHSIAEIGERFGGVSGQAVSNTASAVRRNRTRDPVLDRLLRRLERNLVEKCKMET